MQALTIGHIEVIVSILAFIVPVAASIVGLKVLAVSTTLKNEVQTMVSGVQLEMGKMELRLVQQIGQGVEGSARREAHIEAIFDRLDRIEVRFGDVEKRLEDMHASKSLPDLFGQLEAIERELKETKRKL